MSFDIKRIKECVDQLEQRLSEHTQLKEIRTKIGVPIVYTLMGVIFTVLLLIYLFSGFRALTALVGVIYPTYMSLKALNSEDKGDDELWLAYWVWYSIFIAVEKIIDILLFWVPLYEFFKMGFLIYLYHPKIKGALFLYHKLLHSYVVRFLNKCPSFVGNGCRNNIDEPTRD